MSPPNEITGSVLVGTGRNLGSPTFAAIDPATGAHLSPSFQEAGAEDVAAACELAAQAFGVFSELEPAARGVRAAVHESLLPAGTFSYLPGTTQSVGAALVADPRIRAVGFTGSRAGGLALAKIAAARPEPIPVFAEMSSINPVILFPGAARTRGAQLGR